MVEGRYKCAVILDEEAVLAVGVYIDLNPVAAKIAEVAATSEYTSNRGLRRVTRQRLPPVPPLRHRRYVTTFQHLGSRSEGAAQFGWIARPYTPAAETNRR
jgi:hypothetical protein